SISAIAAEKYAHVQLVLFAFEVIEEPANAWKPPFTLDHQPLLLGIKLRPGHVERQPTLLRETLQLGEERLVFRLGPRLDRALVQRLRRIRDHQVEIEINRVSESLAARASAIWVVERKQARLRLFISNIAALALESLREAQPLLRFAIAGHSLEDHFARLAIADLHRVNNARARIR